MNTQKTLAKIAEEAYAEYGGDMEECFEAAAAAVEAEVLAQQTPMNQNGKPTQALLPLLKTAFCTIRVCSSKKQYELVFSFTDIPALHAAEEEWNKFRVATLSQPVFSMSMFASKADYEAAIAQPVQPARKVSNE